MTGHGDTGILLVNLGSPSGTSVREVRRYLREFLSDPRVLDLPALGRWLLLNCIILPFRPKQSAHAYQQIWTDEGSPLLGHTDALRKGVAASLGEGYSVKYAMRYQEPSIKKALIQFMDEGVERLIVFPLYPHYASSTTGSTLEAVYRQCAAFWNTPSLAVVPPFYDHPAYIKALAKVTLKHLGDPSDYDAVLFSYHGLPERHVIRSEVTKEARCLQDGHCCDAISRENRYCYRAQCMATTRAVAKEMGIDHHRVSFQSRLGKTPWIQPYTEDTVGSMPGDGVTRLAVVCPAFTADCLETIEEIGIRTRETFMAAGGSYFKLIPCLNAEPEWIEAVTQLLKSSK